MKERKLSTLIGLILSDGGISCSHNNAEIFFTNTSEKLIEIFTSISKELFGVEPKIRRKAGKFFQINLPSKSAANFLLSLINTGRKKRCNRTPICPKLKGMTNGSCIVCSPIKIRNDIFPLIKLPDFIKNDRQNKIEFLKIMFSCDGGIALFPRKGKGKLRIEREVFLACKHPLLREMVVDLLSSLGIQAKNDEKKNKVLIRDFENMKKFKDIVGFIDGVLVTKNSKTWRNFEKNKILDIAVKTFEMSKPLTLGLWSKFNSRQEIISFLKSLLTPHYSGTPVNGREVTN
jgi:intein/homing endonuclease